MVSFGRSGNSPESLATTALADELVDDIWHLVLTCDPNGQLSHAHSGRPNSRIVFMPDRTNDTGFAMTSSLTSMLLTCLRLLGPATAHDGDKLATAAEYVSVMQPDIRLLAQAKKQRFVYLGSGSLEGLAHESALKMLELTAGEVGHLLRLAAGLPARAEVRARRRHARRRLRLHRSLHPPLRPRHHRRDPRAARPGRRHGDQRRAHPRHPRARHRAARPRRSRRRAGSPFPTWSSPSTWRCSPRWNAARRPTIPSPPVKSTASCKASPSIR